MINLINRKIKRARIRFNEKYLRDLFEEIRLDIFRLTCFVDRIIRKHIGEVQAAKEQRLLAAIRRDRLANHQKKYEGLWLGKICRPRGQAVEFRKVVKVEVLFSRYFVYEVYLTYADGSTHRINQWGSGRNEPPREVDMEIKHC